MSILIGIIPFVVLIGIYVFFSLLRRLRSELIEREQMDTSSARLFNSKVHDAAFFDGESEEYTETVSRLRQYGGA